MKIILLKDIAKMGRRGDVKDVADGYALNVLIKKGDALQATPSELSRWKAKADSQKYKKDLAVSSFLQLSDILKKTPIVITGKKRDAKGQLFAQIKEHDIAEAIFSSTKVSIDPKQIILPTAVKNIGTHTFTMKQGSENEILKLLVE